MNTTTRTTFLMALAVVEALAAEMAEDGGYGEEWGNTVQAYVTEMRHYLRRHEEGDNA